MKNISKAVKPLLIVPALTATVLLGQSAQALAWTSQHYSPHQSYNKKHDHKHKKIIAPRTTVSLDFGSGRFYYSDGHYDNRHRHSHTWKRPSYGVSVYRLPHGCRKVYRNGIAYYVHNDTYYRQVGNMYHVVQPVVVTPTAFAATASQDIFKINVPSKKGGYTEVALQKSGDGFVGPQGEFYTDFPSIEQLKAMYGK